MKTLIRPFAALRPRRCALVQVHCDAELLSQAPPQFTGVRRGLLHGDPRHRNQRADVHRAEARVLALVSAGRMGDGMQAAGELAGEHRAREGLGDGDDSHTSELGLGWQLAEGLQRAQLALSEDETEEAREHAQHAAAVRCRQFAVRVHRKSSSAG